MSKTRASRGISLPGISQVLVVAAAALAGWLLFSEFHDRGWIPGLHRAPDNNPVNRLQMVNALVNRGSEGVPELVEACADADPKIRRVAIFGLGQIGPQAAEALNLVRKALDDDDPQVRVNAISTFWQISQDRETAAPIVARMLADSHADVRESAAGILETIGWHSIRPAIEMLHSDSAEVRSRTLRILAKLRELGPKAEVDAVVRHRLREEIDAAVRHRLDDPDPQIHFEALCLVVRWGQGSLVEIQELLHNPAAIDVALAAIAHRGPEAEELLPEIIRLIDHQDVLEISHGTSDIGMPLRKIPVLELHFRLRSILQALGSMKTTAKPAVAPLLRRLEELHTGNRILVASTLVDIGVDAEQVVSGLTPLLTEPGSDSTVISQGRVWSAYETAKQAARVLVRASPEEARRQVSHLIPQLTNSEAGVNKTVLYALWGLAPVASDAVPALMELIPNSDGEVFWHAVVTLGEIGTDSAPVVPVLVGLLDDGSQEIDVEILERIIEAFGRIGPTAKRALPALTKVIDNPGAFAHAHGKGNIDWAIPLQLMALAAVGQIGESTPQVLDSLRAQLRSQSHDVGIAVVKSLALVGRNSPEATAEFVQLLCDERAAIRGQAALAIGSLKLDRQEAVGALVKLLADENPYVRTAAAVALGKIGPDAKEALPALYEIQQEPANSLPLWEHLPVGWKPGMPPFERISDLDKMTIHEAVQKSIREIESAPGDRPSSGP